MTWTRQPRPLTSVEVLEIFEKKTAPAFAVALHIGALAAGVEAHEEVSSVLDAYSKALGIAYQIRDDLEDYTTGGAGAPSDMEAMRPGVVLSAAWERAQGEAKAVLTSRWKREGLHGAQAARDACVEAGALDRCSDLLERYKEEAIRSLGELENASLKGLLRRVLGKIFSDTEIKGWCKEFENANGVRS